MAAAVRDSVGLVAGRAMHLRAAAAVTTPAQALPHREAAALGPDAGLADDLDREAVAVASEGAWARAAELLVDASRLSPEQRPREDRLTRAVGALIGAGDVDRALALLRDVEGWEAEEVCEALELSMGNQRVLLHRARSKVRGELERYLEPAA